MRKCRIFVADVSKLTEAELEVGLDKLAEADGTRTLVHSFYYDSPEEDFDEYIGLGLIFLKRWTFDNSTSLIQVWNEDRGVWE